MAYRELYISLHSRTIHLLRQESGHNFFMTSEPTRTPEILRKEKCEKLIMFLQRYGDEDKCVQMFHVDGVIGRDTFVPISIHNFDCIYNVHSVRGTRVLVRLLNDVQ